VERPIRVGISACLLGARVRHDGGHKRDDFVVEALGSLVELEWVPVCPELESGMGVPRPPVRLAQAGGGELRLIDPASGTDHTARLARFAERRVRELQQLDLCGYVLKSDSPSCGLERVAIWREAGAPLRRGRGAFAARLLELMPELPVEEEAGLHDLRRLEHFIERLFAYRRLR
jgi:uncharacterized protein YbbK (DUF523 family)